MLDRLRRALKPAGDFKRMKRQLEAERLIRVLSDCRIDLFVDVGANMGQTAQELRRGGYRGRIVSFEPVQRCHDELVRQSRQDPDWEVYQRCALGEAAGEVELHVSSATDLSSIASPTPAMRQALPRVQSARSERVPVHRLDAVLPAVIGESRRPFLKIDAQGHDMAVLRGAHNVLDRIAGLRIEMSLLPLYQGESLYLEILNYVHAAGFDPVLLVDRGYSSDLGRQLQIDGVFVRKGSET